MPTCCSCLQMRRRAFFHNGVCEECNPDAASAPWPTPVPNWPLDWVISLAARWHDTRPWVTEAQARDKGVPSSAEQMRGYRPTGPVVVTEYPAVFEWLAALAAAPEAECSDYENSLVLLARVGYVTEETWGLACSIFHAWTLTQKDAPAPVAAPAVTGAFYGTIGKRMDLAGLQCYEHRSLGTSPEHPEWGERFLIKFTAPTGEELVWFASAGGKFDPKIGGTYNVRATIAKHEEYLGRRQTILQRPAEYDPATLKLLHPPVRKPKETDE